MKKYLENFNKWFQADYPRTPVIMLGLSIVLMLIYVWFSPLSFKDIVVWNDKPKPLFEDYVKFNHSYWKKYAVVTGSQYKSNDGSPPTNEWCYLEYREGDFFNLTTTAVFLSRVENDGDFPFDMTVSKKQAERFKSTPEEISALAQSHCKFKGA